MPRFEPLSEEALATIEGGWERLGSEVGVRFDHARAIELFQAAGQTVDGPVVRFDPGFLAAQAAFAPAEFSLHARNPERDFIVGGDHMIFGPANGPPFVRVNGERRDGTMADLEQLLKLTQMTDALDTPGRNILEPNDVALDVRHLLRALAAARLTDRVWSGEPSSEGRRSRLHPHGRDHPRRPSGDRGAAGDVRKRERQLSHALRCAHAGGAAHLRRRRPGDHRHAVSADGSDGPRVHAGGAGSADGRGAGGHRAGAAGAAAARPA